MTTTIIDKALRRVADDVAALIEEHADAIRAAISRNCRWSNNRKEQGVT